MSKMLPADYSAKCVEALKALYAPPLSADELAAKRSLEAAEMARAEARRAPASQPGLLP